MRWLFAVALLAGCGTISAQVARREILDFGLPDLLACAGVPDSAMQISPDEMLLQYEFKPQSGSVLAVKIMSLFDLSVGNRGACQAHFRVLRSGEVSGVSYSGTDVSYFAPDSACQALVKECVLHPDRTGIPPGYDAFDYMPKPMKAATP